jgi:hypothetical protein
MTRYSAPHKKLDKKLDSRYNRFVRFEPRGASPFKCKSALWHRAVEEETHGCICDSIRHTG